jgi:hypothetical protein
MSGAPKFKVYRDGEYVAACKFAEDAAMLVADCAFAEVRYEHKRVIWREGSEPVSAGESYDGAAEIMMSRINR